MTRVKLKWDYYEHLMHSQDVERHDAETDHQIALELFDSITVAIQWISALGYDVGEMYSKRIDEKAPTFVQIIKKYREKIEGAIEQAKEVEPWLALSVSAMESRCTFAEILAARIH